MLELLSPSAQAAFVKLIDERVAERVEELLGSAAHKTDASPWFTVTEAADYLRTTPGAIYKRIKRGQLPSYRPEGSTILLRRADLDGAGPRTREVL
jgi:excisionase family DNA binding protein